MYAIKIIPCKDSETLQHLLKEVRTIASIQHPNIIRYHNSWIDEITNDCQIQNPISNISDAIVPSNVSQKGIFIQTELMDLDLQTYIYEDNHDIDEKKYILSSIYKAVCFLHDKNIVHCDIKPSNILLKRFNNKIVDVKLSDFGLVHKIDELHPYLKYYGTEIYMHPMLLDTENPIPNKQTDLYSLIIVAFELMNHAPTKMETIQRIQQFKLKIQDIQLEQLMNDSYLRYIENKNEI